MLLIAFINVIIYKISIVCAEMSLIFVKQMLPTGVSIIPLAFDPLQSIKLINANQVTVLELTRNNSIDSA